MKKNGIAGRVFQCRLLLEDGTFEEAACFLRLLILEGDLGEIVKSCCETALGYRVGMYTTNDFQGVDRGFEGAFRLVPRSDIELRLPKAIDGRGVFEPKP